MDATDSQDIRREEIFSQKKSSLLAWLSKLEEVSLQAETRGDYAEVSGYDLQKQVLEVILRTLTAMTTNESYLLNKGHKFQLRPDVLKLFAEADRQYLLSIISR